MLGRCILPVPVRARGKVNKTASFSDLTSCSRVSEPHSIEQYSQIDSPVNTNHCTHSTDGSTASYGNGTVLHVKAMEFRGCVLVRYVSCIRSVGLVGLRSEQLSFGFSFPSALKAIAKWVPNVISYAGPIHTQSTALCYTGNEGFGSNPSTSNRL